MSKSRKEKLTRMGLFLAYVIITLFFLFPIFWVLSTSLKSVPQLFASPPIWLPTDPAFGNYSYVFNNTPTLRYLLNSALLVSLTVFFTVLIAVLAAYGFSRYAFRSKRPSLLAVLAFQVLSRILLPVSAPGIATAAILTAVLSWSQFVIPFILLDDRTLYPVSVGLVNLQSDTNAVTLHYLAAASMVSVAPVIVVFVLLQRYIVSALTSGAVKG